MRYLTIFGIICGPKVMAFTSNALKVTSKVMHYNDNLNTHHDFIYFWNNQVPLWGNLLICSCLSSLCSIFYFIIHIFLFRCKIMILYFQACKTTTENRKSTYVLQWDQTNCFIVIKDNIVCLIPISYYIFNNCYCIV